MPAAKTERQRMLEYLERMKSPDYMALTFDDLFGHAPLKPDYVELWPAEKDLTHSGAPDAGM